LEFMRNLKQRAITRDLDWGVPVPLPGWEDNPHKKIYVWFDAVIGYLSASIEWAAQRGEPEAWKDWWENPESWHYYVMGKDNITFHTVLWPAILMGAGNLELPDDIVASEYLNMSGKKLSTSRGGQLVFVGDFLDRYDADALRYYLMIAGPENQDTDFTYDEFVRRNNDELVATWGNLVHRTLVNAHRNFGAVPKPQTLHTLLGYDDVIAPQPDVREHSEDGTAHMVITGDYGEPLDRWRPSELEPGRKLPEPQALFKRLDEVVESDS